MTPVDPFALLSFLGSGEAVSRTDLATRLNCSPQAVEEAVDRLRCLGLEVEEGPPGYRLPRVLERLSEMAVREALEPQSNTQVPQLEVLKLVDSTNRHLAASVAGGTAPPGTVTIAECQTGGRGRRGRRWVSPFGQNVYLSLYTGPLSCPFGGGGGFSLLVGLGIVQALGRLGPAGLCLKWPNDLVWDDAKLGGILIEASAGRGGGMVVGVGINVGASGALGAAVNQPWSSLERVPGGVGLSRARVAAGVIEGILAARHRLDTSGLSGLSRDWAAYDGIQGRRVQVHSSGEVMEGVAQGIDGLGRLIVDSGRGEAVFGAGEVSVRWRR